MENWFTKKGRQIKVLHVITGLGIGGAEKLLLLTIKKIDRNVFCPVVVSLYKEGGYIDEFRKTETKVYCLGYKYKQSPLIIWRLTSIIRKEKPSIVHTHLPHATIWGRIASFLSGVRIIVTTEHNISIWNRKNRIFFVLYKLTYKLSSGIIAVSKAVKKTMIESFGIPPHYIEVIYNGVELEKIEKCKEVPIDLEKLSRPIIGTIGRLHKTKGHIYLLRAFEKIRNRFSNANLLIVGDGEQRENLQNLAKELKLSNSIHFLGTRMDTYCILQLIDIFVFPSLEEGLGIALIEACAAGKPCVATNVGGIPEIIKDNENGFLVSPRESDAIAEKVVKILNNVKLSRRMATCGRKIVREKFDIYDKVNRLEKLYLQLYGEIK